MRKIPTHLLCLHSFDHRADSNHMHDENVADEMLQINQGNHILSVWVSFISSSKPLLCTAAGQIWFSLQLHISLTRSGAFLQHIKCTKLSKKIGEVKMPLIFAVSEITFLQI
ncbi:hypothetical protein ATANTOWER_000250 [Ataeniobius toweri]|uniref:Uncharacterized protein n=1 Tax=Ataeniobius toweri TaxID=208326 RepID=A0ABU7A3V2_9TELE|nr:hypothetical protein [Ataeniobius toweri]